MNYLKKIGLLSMTLFSGIHSKTKQTLFLSPKLDTTECQEQLRGKNSVKLSFFCDIHHVLFEHAKSPYLSSFGKIKNKPKFLWRSTKTLFSPAFWKKTQALKKNNIKVTEAYITELSPKLTADLRQFMTDMYVPNAKMHKKISVLKNRGHELYLLSNIGPKLLEHLQYDYPDFFTIFDRQQNTINYDVLNNNVWLSKPHVSSYLHALTITNKLDAPWLSVFVDDKKENIKGALEAGLNAILFVSPEQFETDTQKLYNHIKTIAHHSVSEHTRL